MRRCVLLFAMSRTAFATAFASSAPLVRRLQELGLQAVWTSGYNYNCLWFGVQVATGAVAVAQQCAPETEEEIPAEPHDLQDHEAEFGAFLG